MLKLKKEKDKDLQHSAASCCQHSALRLLWRDVWWCRHLSLYKTNLQVEYCSSTKHWAAVVKIWVVFEAASDKEELVFLYLTWADVSATHDRTLQDGGPTTAGLPAVLVEQTCRLHIIPLMLKHTPKIRLQPISTCHVFKLKSRMSHREGEKLGRGARGLESVILNQSEEERKNKVRTD